MEISQDEFQRKRNKVGYAYTIVGLYFLIALSGLLDRVGGDYLTILPSSLSLFVLLFNLVVVKIAVILAIASVFWALIDPRWSVVLFIITGVIIGISALVVTWFYIFALFSLIPDVHKTRKIANLAKEQ